MGKKVLILECNYIVKNLAPFEYYLVKYTLGLLKHKTRPTTVIFCVDGFEIKSFIKNIPAIY